MRERRVAGEPNVRKGVELLAVALAPARLRQDRSRATAESMTRQRAIVLTGLARCWMCRLMRAKEEEEEALLTRKEKEKAAVRVENGKVVEGEKKRFFHREQQVLPLTGNS